MGNVAKTLTYYLEPAEGTSEDEFITTFAYSVLVEKSGIVSLEHSSLLSGTKILNDTRDVLHPITDSSELISNKAKVFELRKRSGSLVTDIFVGRAPTNDIVLANPSVSKSHLRVISIPRTKHHQLVDMFSSNGTYLNGWMSVNAQEIDLESLQQPLRAFHRRPEENSKLADIRSQSISP